MLLRLIATLRASFFLQFTEFPTTFYATQATKLLPVVLILYFYDFVLIDDLE